MSEAELTELKEWLNHEVRLERYFDKLIGHGFSSLDSLLDLTENDLDAIGIVPAYHRKRLLKYCAELHKKDSESHVNAAADVIQTGSAITDVVHETSDEESHTDGIEPTHGVDDVQPPPLPPKSNDYASKASNKGKPSVPDRDSSLPRQQPAVAARHKLMEIPQASPLTGAFATSNNIPELKGKAKGPPPIPPRADLDSEKDQNASKQDEKDSILIQYPSENIESSNHSSVMSAASSSVAIEGDQPSSPKPVARPRRIPSSKHSSIDEPSNDSQSNGTPNVPVHNTVIDLKPCDEAVPSLPEKPAPKPRPRIKPRPILPKNEHRHSVAVPSKSVDIGYVSEMGKEDTSSYKKDTMSLDRASNLKPLPNISKDIEEPPSTLTNIRETTSQEQEEKLPSPVNKAVDIIPDNDTYDVVAPQVIATPGEATYECIQDIKAVKPEEISPESTYEAIELRKPKRNAHAGKHVSIFGNETKIRNSMFGLMGLKKGNSEDIMYDYESDESVEDILISEPPLKPRSDSAGSLTDGRPVSIAPTKSRKNSGYLYKQGGQKNNKGWSKRWFVFDGKTLRYYRTEENTSESLHIIPVSQMKSIDYDDKNDDGRARFKLVTENRVFMLASNNMTDANLWAQTLMEAIIQSKDDNLDKKPEATMAEPDKEGWLKKQGHNVMGDWRRRYIAIKGEHICYYDTREDFVHETPIHCIDAKLASVRPESHRNRFQIITPNKTFCFQADNEFEAGSWISAVQTAIQMGLSDHSIINKVWLNPSNKLCADCGRKDPVWAAVNYCVCVCALCIGIHRNLGVRFSKPRSLLMDQRIWNEQLVELMLRIGNENANKVLEFRIPEDDRITPESTTEKRIEFIFSKYKDMKYSKISQNYGQPNALGQSLQEAVVTDDVLKTMELIINKADVKFVDADSEDQRTPYELAKDAGQELQVEFLHQNGGDAVVEDSPPREDDTVEGLPSIEVTSPLSPTTEVPEKAGFLFKKDGSSMKKRYWFTLKDRNLKYYRVLGDKDPLGVIDLTTVTSVELNTADDNRTLDIITTEKTYTVKGDTDEELDSWYYAIKNKQVFNIHLSYQELGSDGIPHLVANCLQFVETYGLQAEGIYRVNGNQAKIRALKQAFNQNASRVLLTLDEYSVHDVTGTLKKYLRELPEPVFPVNMYKLFITVSRNPDHSAKLTGMKDTLAQLPKVNYDTLKRIIGHLTKVIADQAVNRMGIENISMIFGPTLMSNQNTGKMDDSSINQEFTIVGEMIHYYQWLFDVDDKELEKDKLMEDAMKKIIQLRECSAVAKNQEFTLSIFVQTKNDSPCLVKVAAGMPAGELCMNIVSQKNLPPEGNWVLFEVIEKLNLERALQFREKVLPVVMAWEDFGEIRKDNHLIIKPNHIQESIQPFVGSILTLEGQLYVREHKRKDWKQSMVVLKNGKMVMDKSKSFFKSIKSDKSDADQWSLHNLFVYVGVPTDKQTKGVDTSAGFTVVVKTDQLGNIIRYLCARDRTEMYRWVAAILNMKHPEGIWNDPTSHRVQDKQVFLGRQSQFLRREGSSKYIADEIKHRQKSLRRSVHKS